jgi:CRISPR-associated endonuclease/helicase Cas3
MPAKNEFYAHTPPPDEPERWHLLTDHLQTVAETAAGFGQPFGLAELARWCGLLHDMGKFSPAFQRYLRECDIARRAKRPAPKAGSAEHKGAGTQFALDNAGPIIRDIAASCVLGHHGGLVALKEFKNDLEARRNRTDFAEATDGARTVISGLQTAPVAASIPLFTVGGLPKDRQKQLIEFHCRMVFSCLVDADSLDTARHHEPDVAMAREETATVRYAASCGWRTLLKKSQEGLSSDDTAVNRVRRAVYESSLKAAVYAPGVFLLTVPTGGGKTRSSLAFALAHAEAQPSKAGPRRIIYAIPYTSIIDQTARVFREILGEDAVLEHHSAIEVRDTANQPGDRTQAELSPEQLRRLAAENWDAPLIVTTTVQLFESLFSNRPARCRKLHNLVNSIIILDEVQTLPVPLLAPLLDGLRILVDCYGVTVVLCTATQPAIAEDTPYLKGLPQPRPIIADPRPHFEGLKRVIFRTEPQTWSWQRLAEAARDRNASCLIVLNTKKDAVAVLQACRETGIENLHHLSTLLCGAHRRDVLDTVKAALAAEREEGGPPVVLVSTQVIEAGVDIDFPFAYRAKGPLDRIVQAAGRVNREGLRDWSASEVVVFDPEEGSLPPGSYATATDLAWNLMCLGGEAFDFDSPEAVTEYFRQLYYLKGAKGLDADSVQDARIAWDFPYVAEKMRLIREDTAPVLVPYPPEVAEKLENEVRSRLARGYGLSRELWQRLQPRTVAVARRDLQRFESLVPEQLWVSRIYDRELLGLGIDGVIDPNDLIA